MSVTQKDISKKVGVSPGLVGFAFNGSGRIGEATRRRILQAAAEMGYTPHANSAARNLAARRYGKAVRTGVLAVVMSPNSDGQVLTDIPFFAPFFNGMALEAADRQMEVCLCPFDSEMPRLIASRSVDGVICIGNIHHRTGLLVDLPIPTVTLDSFHERTLSILPNDNAGARLATEHLIKGGHRHVSYLGIVLETEMAMDRLDGYRRALQAAGLKVDEGLIVTAAGTPNFASGHAGVVRLLEEDAAFTGIVCYNDLMAMGAIEALREAGRRVPQDISVTGFDDVLEAAEYSPPLTTVGFDRTEMGREAVRRLYDDDDLIPRRVVFPVELVVRKSTRELNS